MSAGKQHNIMMEALFSGRLMNLSAVYKHLSDSEWRTASVPDLVRASVEPYCAADYKDCDLDGPELAVSASMALSLIMILHELAANAASTAPSLGGQATSK